MIHDLIQEYRAAKQKLAELEAQKEYVAVKDAIAALEAAITEEVKTLGKSQTVEGVKISYRKGTTRVDYEKAAKALKVPTTEYETVKVDFTKAVKAANPAPEDLAPFTKVGEPTVKIEIEG